MKIILIQDVENLGKIGDSVNVKPGYARNFLIPHKLALSATEQNMKSIESRLQQQELKNAKIIESWAGMVETTPDVVPIICEISSIPGFYIGTGFSGHGFGIGPGAGEAIARMIQNKDNIDLAPFKLERFFDGTPIRPNSTI